DSQQVYLSRFHAASVETEYRQGLAQLSPRTLCDHEGRRSLGGGCSFRGIAFRTPMRISKAAALVGVLGTVLLPRDAACDQERRSSLCVEALGVKRLTAESNVQEC